VGKSGLKNRASYFSRSLAGMKNCWRTGTAKEEGTMERMHLNDARTWESALPDLLLKFDRRLGRRPNVRRLGSKVWRLQGTAL